MTRTTITIPQAATALGIARSTAYSLAQLGSLPGAVKLGGTYRVAVGQLAQVLGITPEELLDTLETDEVAV